MLAKELGDLFLNFGSPRTDFHEMPGAFDGIKDCSGDSAGQLPRLRDRRDLVRCSMNQKGWRGDFLHGEIGRVSKLAHIISKPGLSGAEWDERANQALEPFELLGIVEDVAC